MKIQEQANYSNHSFEIADKATLFEVYFHLNPCYNSPILSLGTHSLFFVLDFFKVFIISCRTLQFKNINNLGRENVRKKEILMKKLLFFLSCGWIFLTLSGCSSTTEAETSTEKDSDSTLVVYSPNPEDLIEETVPAFEEKYGIKVDLVQASTGELFKKAEAEKESPVADVIFGGSYALFSSNENLFEPYISQENDQIIPEYQNKTGFYTPYTLDVSVIIANSALTKDIKIEGYNDLLNPKLKGKIATADPSNASSAFAQLTNMLVDQGGYENEQAWTYVKNLFTLVDGKIASSSSNVYKAVADGEMAVGLTYEDPALKLLNDGVDVKVIYPKEGTVFLPGNAAIIKNAKHMENAKKFIDFLLSQEIQDKLGTETTIRPIRKNARTNKNMKAMTEINIATEDSDYVIKNKSAILKKYNDIFTDIQSKQ